MIRSERRILARRVLTNQDVSEARRSLLAQSLVFSKGFYNSGTWHGLTSAQLAKMHAATMDVYRTVADQRCDGLRRVDTDEQVIRRLGAVAPAVMVKMARMATFGRIARAQPVALLRMLEAAAVYKGSWLEAVCADFDWVTMVSDDLASWRGRSLSSWAAQARDGYKELRESVPRVCRLPTSNACIAWATTASQRSLGEAWFCYDCGVQFKNKQAWGAHRAKKHGIKRVIRQYLDGTHCIGCMMEFHARDRLVQHLERASPPCRQLVLDVMEVLPPDTVQRLDAEAAAHVRELTAAGRHRVHASLPAVRLPGPLLPDAAFVRTARGYRRRRAPP